MAKAIALSYFSFTTLSSVGFGDYHPISDGERGFVCFLLIIGVAIYSYIGTTYDNILHKISTLNEEINESDSLDGFLAVIKRFNGG